MKYGFVIPGQRSVASRSSRHIYDYGAGAHRCDHFCRNEDRCFFAGNLRGGDNNICFGNAFGYIKSPDTNYVLLGCGIGLIIFGIILWHSIGTRIYVLNMLGKVKHEISDVETINSLKLKDYQLKETVLDLRWAANDVNQQTWEKAKAQIEEYSFSQCCTKLLCI